MGCLPLLAMKVLVSLAVSFESGAVFAAVLVLVASLRGRGRRSQLFLSSYLRHDANGAQRLSRGERKEVPRGMEERLPLVVFSVHGSGENEATRGALRQAREFYVGSGLLVPREIEGMLSSLR